MIMRKGRPANDNDRFGRWIVIAVVVLSVIAGMIVAMIAERPKQRPAVEVKSALAATCRSSDQGCSGTMLGR